MKNRISFIPHQVPPSVRQAQVRGLSVGGRHEERAHQRGGLRHTQGPENLSEKLSQILVILSIVNPLVTSVQHSWALSVFFNFTNHKNLFFFIFYQVNLTGSGLFKLDWCGSK